MEKEQLVSFLSQSKYGILAFLLPFVIYVLSLRYFDYTYGFNVMAMQFAMWKNHEFFVGTVANPLVPGNIPNVDTISFQGRYYVAYAPGLAFISFPFTVVGFMLDGGAINPQGNAIVMLELFVALTGALGCYILYKASLFYASALPALLASLTFAFGTSAWPFASVVFPHDTSMLFSFSATYLVLKFAKSDHGKSNLLLALAGFCLGIATFVDYLAILLILPLGGYLIYATHQRTSGRSPSDGILNYLSRIGSFLFPFLLAGPTLIFGYNYANFGSPLTFPEEYYKYAAPSARSLGGLATRFHLSYIGYASLFNLFSPYRGIIVLSPVLILGFYGLYRMSKSREYRADSILFIALFLTVFLSFSAWSDWAGGASYGPRFLVPGLPYLVLPILVVLGNSRRILLQIIYFLLFVASAFTQGMGALVNATPPLVSFPPPVMQYQLTYYAIPELLSGKVGMWWLEKSGVNSDVATDVFAVGVILLLVFSIAGYFTYRNVKEGSIELGAGDEDTISSDEAQPEIGA